MIQPETKPIGMKQIAYFLYSILGLSLLTACAGSSQPYAYDDVYYSPSNDPVRQAQSNPRDDFNKTDDISYKSYPNRYNEGDGTTTNPQEMYQNRYTETEQIENQQPSTNNGNNQTVIINNNDSDEGAEYYDPDYARTVNRLNTPIQSFNAYDPYQRDRVRYTVDPFFYQPSLYGNYAFWDPFVPTSGLRIGWNSWSGWNVGVGIGFGYSSWAGYDPFWNPWRPAFGYNPYNPWFPSYGWGYGYGWGCDPYRAGFNRGYYNGAYAGNNGYYDGGGVGRTNINTPRGSSGSRSFNSGRERSPRPGSSGTNNRMAGDDYNTSRKARPAQSREAVSRDKSNSTTRESSSRETPSRYATDRNKESYSRPASRPTERTGSESTRQPAQSRPNSGYNPSSRPSTTTRPSSRPSSTQPSRSNENSSRQRTRSSNYSNQRYNNNSSTQPSQSTRSSGSQSRPSNNYRQSRPSYNRTPSYSPSRGGSSTPARRSSPSRSGSRQRR